MEEDELLPAGCTPSERGLWLVKDTQGLAQACRASMAPRHIRAWPPSPGRTSWPPADGSPSAGLELFSICTWPCGLAPAHWQGVQAPGQGGHRGPGCPAWGHVPTGLSSQVSNGASPQDERTTSLLVFSFLQSCPHSRCRQELEMLGHKLSVRAAHDDELQTDGNWCSHFRREGAAETGRRRASLRGPDAQVHPVSSGAGLAESRQLKPTRAPEGCLRLCSARALLLRMSWP